MRSSGDGGSELQRLAQSGADRVLLHGQGMRALGVNWLAGRERPLMRPTAYEILDNIRASGFANGSPYHPSHDLRARDASPSSKLTRSHGL